MIPLTNNIKEKINLYRRNKIDISDLIVDIDLKGADLSYCVIKKLKRIDKDISGCNFSYAILGCDEDIIQIIKCKMKGCNFQGANFVGPAFMRSCDAQNCNFKKANVSKIDYQYSDFRGSSFCEAIITIGTNQGLGCLFPKEVFEDLCKGWKMKIKVESEE